MRDSGNSMLRLLENPGFFLIFGVFNSNIVA